MTERRAPGYMVWNPQGHKPRFTHATLSAATTEAKRLAKANPGHTFYVMAPVTFAEVPTRLVRQCQPFQTGTVQQVADFDADDEIPF